jgi:hypothetical protein
MFIFNWYFLFKVGYEKSVTADICFFLGAHYFIIQLKNVPTSQQPHQLGEAVLYKILNSIYPCFYALNSGRRTKLKGTGTNILLGRQ